MIRRVLLGCSLMWPVMAQAAGPPFLMEQAGLIDLDSRVAIVGNSKDTTFTQQVNHPTWATIEQTGARLYLGPFANQGQGGGTTTDYLARISFALATKPSIMMIGDATNDASANTPAATIEANYASLIATIEAANVPKIVIQTTPYRCAYTTPQRAIVDTVNTWVRALPAGDPILTLADTAALSGYDTCNPVDSFDGTHPTAYGALNQLGVTQGNALKAQVAPGNVFPQDGSELAGNLNPFWAEAGTGGTLAGVGISGVAADGLTITNTTGATVVASKGTMANGDDAQVIALSGVCTPSTGFPPPNLVIETDATSIVTTPGDYFENLREYEISNAAGDGVPTGVQGFGMVVLDSHLYQPNIQSEPGQFPQRSAIGRSQPFQDQSVLLNLTDKFTISCTGTSDMVLKLGHAFTRQTELVAYGAPVDQSLSPTNFWTGAAVSGSPVHGHDLTALPGAVSGGGLVYSYQWYADGVAVGGATSRTYHTLIGDVGKTFTCDITSTNTFGAVLQSSTNSIGPIT